VFSPTIETPTDRDVRARALSAKSDLPLLRNRIPSLPVKVNFNVSAKPDLQIALTGVTLQATGYSRPVRIRNFAHKGLQRFYTEDIAKGVPPDTVDKLRKMFAFLDDMEEADELRALTAWKVHTLAGDRKGTWSLSVTRNRRLTFRIDAAEREICDLNLEDYH